MKQGSWVVLSVTLVVISSAFEIYSFTSKPIVVRGEDVRTIAGGPTRADSLFARLGQLTIQAADSPRVMSPTELKQYSLQMHDVSKALQSASIDQASSSVSLIIKAAFSGVLMVAALFVILSQKYDEDTRKWAFSVLSLVAGVWIGTAAK